MLDSLAQYLVSSSFQVDFLENVLRVENSETGSSYVIEHFDGALQIRQAIEFEFASATEEYSLEAFRLINSLNERFIACKLFIDQWGTLVNACDLLPSTQIEGLVLATLPQIEFVSAAMLQLLPLLKEWEQCPSELQIDEALAMDPAN